jgi:[NiFe] hydrogenase assembly HybE family chaperone
MADVPILNAALRVEAVGFQRWQGYWLGIVVTPWCMSVLLVPESEAGGAPAGANQRRYVRVPYGELAFLNSSEPELGAFQTCALFSPMDRFATQAQASSTARAAMLALMAPPPQAQAAPRDSASCASRRRFLGLGQNAHT